MLVVEHAPDADGPVLGPAKEKAAVGRDRDGMDGPCRRVEAAQLDSAAALVEEARQVLDGRTWTPGELHLLAVELTAALAQVHRVAESRGARLAAPGDAAAPDAKGDAPRLPAEAFG